MPLPGSNASGMATCGRMATQLTDQNIHRAKILPPSLCYFPCTVHGCSELPDLLGCSGGAITLPAAVSDTHTQSSAASRTWSLLASRRGNTPDTPAETSAESAAKLTTRRLPGHCFSAGVAPGPDRRWAFSGFQRVRLRSSNSCRNSLTNCCRSSCNTCRLVSVRFTSFARRESLKSCACF